MTFIFYGKVTQILFHQFTWVCSQTDLSYWRTNLIWICFSWERYFFFFFLLWVILLLMSIYIRDTISRNCKTHKIWFCSLVIGLMRKIILYTCKKSTQWYQIKSFCIINISRNIIHFQINVLSKMYNKQTSAVLIKWYCWI